MTEQLPILDIPADDLEIDFDPDHGVAYSPASDGDWYEPDVPMDPELNENFEMLCALAELRYR